MTEPIPGPEAFQLDALQPDASQPPPSYSSKQIRRVDEVAINEWGIPGTLLMENAGRGVADVMCEAGIEGKVIVACAKGNNGGDGFVLARQLHLRGFDVEILMCCDPADIQGDAKVMFDIVSRCDIPMKAAATGDALLAQLQSADWLVDALLGTGTVGAPRPPLDEIIQAMNATMAMRLAVDVPSGLDCDTGVAAQTTFRANVTCTFVALKNGFLVEQARPYLGEVHCLDIGLPWSLVERALETIG